VGQAGLQAEVGTQAPFWQVCPAGQAGLQAEDTAHWAFWQVWLAGQAEPHVPQFWPLD